VSPERPNPSLPPTGPPQVTGATSGSGLVVPPLPSRPPVIGGYDPPPATPGGQEDAGDARQVQISESALGAVTPVVGGTRRVTGRWAFWQRAGGWIYAAVLLCEGPVAAVSDIQIDGTPIADVAEVAAYEVRTGEATQTRLWPTVTELEPFSTYPGAVLIGLKLSENGDGTTAMGGWKVTGEVSGLVEDFRTGATVASANPVVLAYHVLTSGDPWARTVDPSQIDLASWTAAADHADEVMSDGTTRYEYNGLITERDPIRAARTLLAHAAARLVEYDGTLYVVQDRQTTETGAEIAAGEWVVEPAASESAASRRPTAVRARYYTTDGQMREVVVQWPGVDPDQAVEELVTYPGCTATSQAVRLATLRLNRANLETWSWDGTVGPAAADLLPGDVIRISAPGGLDRQLVRVRRVVEAVAGARYRLVADEYDPAAYTDVVAPEDTPVDVGTWPPPAPEAPTGIVQTFVEVGDLDGLALVPPADCSTSEGWSGDSGMTGGYDAGEDAATVTNPDGMVWTDGSPEERYWGHDFDPGDADAVQVAFVARVGPLETSDPSLYCQPVAYYWRYTADGVEQARGAVAFGADTTWARVSAVIKVDKTASVHRFEFVAQAAAGNPTCPTHMTGHQTLYVKRVRVIPHGAAGGAGIVERWTWTNPANAAATVLRHEVRYGWALEPLGTVPGEAEVAWIGPAPGVGPQVPDPPSLDAVTPRWFSAGRGGRVEWPALTRAEQAFELAGVLIRVAAAADVDTTGQAAGALLAVGSDGKTHEYQGQGAGSGLDADTVDGKHAADLEGPVIARGTVAASGAFSVDLSAYDFTSAPRVSLEAAAAYQTGVGFKTIRLALLTNATASTLNGRLVRLRVNDSGSCSLSDDTGTVHWLAVEA